MHTYKLVTLIVLFAAQIVTRADTVYLTDGTKREGTVVDDDSSGTIKLQVKHGPLVATVEIPRREILRVDVKAVAADENEIQFQLLRKEAQRLATLDKTQGGAAWLRFAQFCEDKHGYNGYAAAAYEKALDLAPNLAEARTALGYILTDDGWVKPGAQKDNDSILVGRRYVPFNSVTEDPNTYMKNANTLTAGTYSAPVPIATPSEAKAPDYSTETANLAPSSIYTRNTYYQSGYDPYPVVYLGSVNGQLAPVSASQFWYGNNSGNSSNYVRNYGNNMNCNNNTVGTSTGSTLNGRVGYYSDGYYRSSNTGVQTYVSGNLGSSTRFSGTINGGTSSSSSTNTSGSYLSGPNYGYGFRTR